MHLICCSMHNTLFSRIFSALRRLGASFFDTVDRGTNSFSRFSRDDETFATKWSTSPNSLQTNTTVVVSICGDERKQAVRILLKAGANLESTTDQMFTPLLIAVFNGKLKLAKSLVAEGARIEARNKQHYTSLGIAAQQGHTDLMGFLMDRYWAFLYTWRFLSSPSSG